VLHQLPEQLRRVLRATARVLLEEDARQPALHGGGSLRRRPDVNPGELSCGGGHGSAVCDCDAASRGTVGRQAERIGERFEGDLDLLATNGAPSAAAGVVGDELGDEVRARDAGGGEVEADEVDDDKPCNLV
jgi:hypothetical protein